MAVIFNFVLPVLAGISIILVFIFLYRALTTRSRVSHQAYEVGRVETRQRAQINLVRAFFALLFALFFLALTAVGPRLSTILVPPPTPTPVATAVPPTTTPTETVTNTPLPATLPPTLTPPVPTATVTNVPTETPTPEPPTATVSSGVGIYLRDAPGTASAELQYLEDGTILILLTGVQTADDLIWQEVRTAEGLVGWVAIDFITIDQP